MTASISSTEAKEGAGYEEQGKLQRESSETLTPTCATALYGDLSDKRAFPGNML